MNTVLKGGTGQAREREREADNDLLAEGDIFIYYIMYTVIFVDWWLFYVR